MSVKPLVTLILLICSLPLLADEMSAQFGKPPALAPPAPPYIGVSYYPEVARGQITNDIAHMHDLGMNLVRFGGFSWSRMETNDGRFNFGWLHTAVKQFSDANLAIQ